MSNIALPAILNVSSVSPRLVVPAQQNRSAWSGRSKILGLPGAEYWTAKASFKVLAREDFIRQARAFFFSLRGKINTFDLPVTPTPQEGANTTVASGGAQGARTINLTSVANILPGKFIDVTLPSGHRRLMVPVSTVGSVVNFEPSMPENAAAGAAVQIVTPCMRARLAQSEFEYVDAGGLVTFEVDVEEAF